jgi:hypothetical protein
VQNNGAEVFNMVPGNPVNTTFNNTVATVCR